MATSITRSLRKGLTPAQPLPFVPALADLYAKYGRNIFCLNQLVMIAGRSGSQKSGFLLWLVSQWNLPTLYVNGDMSAWTANSRMLSIHGDLTSEDVREILHEDGVARAELERKAQDSKVWFLHSSRPSLDDIEEELDAYVEAWDAYPPVICIDNLVDLEPLSGDDTENLNEQMQQLKAIREKTEACVAVLHHNKAEGDASYPSPLEGLKFKVDTHAESIVSVALESRADRDELPFRVSVVKQRDGKGTRKADSWVELIAVPDKTQFKRLTFEQVAIGNGWGS